MPLYILVPMIAIGLPAVVFLVYWTGRDKRRRPLERESVRLRFSQDFPAAEVGEILVTDNGATALIPGLSGGKVGLVHAIGQNHLTRLLNAELIREAQETDKGVDLYVNDFTLKRVFLPFADAQARKKALDSLAFE